MKTVHPDRKQVANAAAIISALATVLAAFCAGCRPQESPTETRSNAAALTGVSHSDRAALDRRIQVFSPETGKIRHEVEVSGTVEGYETARLLSKVDGYVSEVLVNIGDHVKKGDRLAALDLPELEDEVERQRRLVDQAAAMVASRQADVALAEAKIAEHDASLRMERSEHNRVARLVSGGSLNQQHLDEAKYAVESELALKTSAHAQIESANAHLDSAHAALNVARADLHKAESLARYGKINAPFDGLITERMIDSGAFVRPASSAGAGSSMFTVTRVDKVRIVAFLPMDEAGRLDVGDRIALRNVQSLPDLDLSAMELTISRIARSFDKNSRMMRCEVDVDNEQMKQLTGSAMTPGDYIRLAVVLDAMEDEIVVPEAAVGKDDRGAFVMIVNANHQCHRTSVKVLQRSKGFVAIRSPELIVGATLLASADEFPDGTQLSSDELIRE
jgi:multidrug efflux pump subunit AcrA (membrane-fusion protein)